MINFNDEKLPWRIFTIAAGANEVVTSPFGQCTITHLGIRDNLSPPTASGANDYVVITRESDTSELADFSDGTKCVLFPMGHSAINTMKIPAGASGERTIRITAVNGAAKILILKG